MGSEHFRFDTLLKIRENYRDEMRGELVQAENRENEERLRLAEIDDQIRRNQESREEAFRSSSLVISKIQRLEAHRQALQERRKEKLAALEALREETEKRRGIFNEAVQNVRILENLRDRQASERRQAEKESEQKAMDALGQRGKIK